MATWSWMCPGSRLGNTLEHAIWICTRFCAATSLLDTLVQELCTGFNNVPTETYRLCPANQQGPTLPESLISFFLLWHHVVENFGASAIYLSFRLELLGRFHLLYMGHGWHFIQSRAFCLPKHALLRVMWTRRVCRGTSSGREDDPGKRTTLISQ